MQQFLSKEANLLTSPKPTPPHKLSKFISPVWVGSRLPGTKF